MSVIRIHHSKNYTVISNNAIRDSQLSLKARGLHHLLLSYPDHWEFTVKSLAKLAGEGKASVATGLQELEKLGYLTRHQENKGKFSEMVYEIYELPQILSDSPQSDFPRTDFPRTDFPLTGNRTHINTIKKEILSSKKDCLSDDVKNFQNFDKEESLQNQLINDVLKDARVARFFEQEGYLTTDDVVSIIKQFLRWLEDKFSSNPNIRSPIAVAVTTVRNIETENHLWEEFIHDRTETTDLINDPELQKLQQIYGVN